MGMMSLILRLNDDEKEGVKRGILNNMIKSGVQVSIRFFDLS